MARRGATLALLSLAGAAAEEYVSFHLQSFLTSSPPARTLSTAVLQHTVADTSALGRYLWMFGGLGSGSTTLDDLWMHSFQDNTWSQVTATGATPIARRAASMVLWQQRYAYLFGGETGGRVRKNDMYVLHVGNFGANPVWEAITYNTSGTTAPVARSEHSMTGEVMLLPILNSPSGMILFGGVDQAGKALDDLHAFEFGTAQWHALSPTGTAPQKRKGHTATVLLNSLMALFGGSDQDVPVTYDDVHLLDLRRNVWMQPTATGVSRPVGRDGHTMVAIDEIVYIFGGTNAAGDKLNDLWAFNAYSAVSGHLHWFQPFAMSTAPAARWGHSALLSMGAMILLGGADSADSLLADVWKMDAGCSGDLSLTGSRGAFSDGDGSYRNNLDCRWTIAPTLANSVVMLFITELELLDDADRLQIYDGSAITSTQLASYTGSTVPPSTVSSGASLLVRFTSNAAGEAGAGFTAAYHAVCSAGYLWNEVSASCEPCPAGSYSEIANAPSCQPCPLGTYAATTGQTACTACPTAATTVSPGAYLPAACTCMAGHFGWDNMCIVCPTGGECPGGNLVRAKSGWCEGAALVNGSSSIPTYKHCCNPDNCPGGIAAACDPSVPTVEGDDCAVRTLSWDSLGQVSLTTGTAVTLSLLVLLLLLLAFCGGILFGIRRMLQKYLQRAVVPTEEPLDLPKMDSLSKPLPPAVEMATIHTPIEPFSPAPMVLPPGGAWAPPPAPTPPPVLAPAPAPMEDEALRAYEHLPPMDTPSDVMPNSMMMMGRGTVAWEPGQEGGGGGGGEDIMLVDVDDLLLGANAPLPAMVPDIPIAPPDTAPSEVQSAAPATEGGGGDDESVAGSTKGKKKKKKKADDDAASEGGASAADGDEGDEGEGDDGKKKGKKGKGDKKGKKGKGDEGDEGGGGEDETPKKDKKDKKKKKDK